MAGGDVSGGVASLVAAGGEALSPGRDGAGGAEAEKATAEAGEIT